MEDFCNNSPYFVLSEFDPYFVMKPQKQKNKAKAMCNLHTRRNGTDIPRMLH